MTNFYTDTTYEWVGTTNLSQSIKKVNGVEVSRNYCSNPSFETQLTSWNVIDTGTGSLQRVIDASKSYSGTSYLSYTQDVDGDPSIYDGGLYTSTLTGPPEGVYDYAGVYIGELRINDPELDLNVELYASVSGTYKRFPVKYVVQSPPSFYLGTELPETRMGSRTVKIVYDLTSLDYNSDSYQIHLQFTGPNGVTAGTVVELDGVMFVAGNSMADVLEQMEYYWDGNTPNNSYIDPNFQHNLNTKWDDGTLTYGIDRGMLYTQDGVGYPWSGLIGFDKEAEYPSDEKYYLDGIERGSIPSTYGISGTIKTYSVPDKFKELSGSYQLSSGVFIENQPSVPFNFSYRQSLVDRDGTPYHLIHIVFNVVADYPSTEASSVGDDVEPVEFEIPVRTTPIKIGSNWGIGSMRTSTLTIDSRLVSKGAFANLEATLYGYDSDSPYLPDMDGLYDVIENY